MSQVTFGNLSAATKTLIKGPYRLPWTPLKYPGEAECRLKINSSVTYITACRFTIRKSQSLSRDFIVSYLLLPPEPVRKPHLNDEFITMRPFWPVFQHLPFRRCSLLPTTFTALADGNEESPRVGVPRLLLSDHGEAANTHVAGTQCTPCSHEMRGPNDQSQLPPQDSAISPMKGVGQ